MRHRWRRATHTTTPGCSSSERASKKALADGVDAKREFFVGDQHGLDVRLPGHFDLDLHLACLAPPPAPHAQMKAISRFLARFAVTAGSPAENSCIWTGRGVGLDGGMARLWPCGLRWSNVVRSAQDSVIYHAWVCSLAGRFASECIMDAGVGDNHTNVCDGPGQRSPGFSIAWLRLSSSVGVLPSCALCLLTRDVHAC